MLLGDYGVGKTTLIQSYFNDSYFGDSKPNIGIETFFKKQGKTTIKYWDTAGQERYNSSSLPYIKNAKAIILVYDPSLPLEEIQKTLTFWIEQIKENLNYDDINQFIWIVANNKNTTIDIKKVNEIEKLKNLLTNINLENRLYVIHKLSTNITELKVSFSFNK